MKLRKRTRKIIGADLRPDVGRLTIILFACLMLSLPLTAQTNEENYGQLEFNFITPGARATAMGGAFIGLADDATAAESNPAGLVILSRPEASFELKQLKYSREMYIDEDSWLNKKKSNISDSAFSPSFFSYVHPWERFTLALYRNETVHFKQKFSTHGPVVGDFDGETWQLFPVDSRMDMTLVNYGLSGAYRFCEYFSAGASIRYSSLNVNTRLTRWDFDRNMINNQSNVDDSDSSITFNLGMLFTISHKLSAGAVYRNGGKYNMFWTRVIDPSGDNVRENERLTFNVPDVYGIGMAYRPMEPLVLVLDVVRVGYSVLNDDMIMVYSGDVLTAGDYEVDDGTEIHLGAEYTWLVNEMPVSVRGGFYTDPDGSLKFKGQGNTVDYEAQRVLFPGGDDQVHFTLGGGIVVKENLQFDLAVDYAEFFSQVSLSGIYRF